MKRNTIAVVICSVAMMLLAGCQTAPSQAKAWEYKVVSARLYYMGEPEQGLGKRINQAAAEGWELVSTGNDDGCPFVIMRKPK